jgi:hypothetical protein
MDNRIRQIVVRDRSRAPAQAEVWLSVFPEFQTPATEIRGRLMGPRCPYASTVEVAYPLRPLPPGSTPTEPDSLTMRVIIPEASLWEPQCPFLYEGPIELWQDGRRCDRIVLRHGLRSLRITERGLHVNGRPLTLHGRSVTSCSVEEAARLRQAGCNLLVALVEASTLALCELADHLGFFMLGKITNDDAETRGYLELLSRQPSCLGWLMEESEGLPFSMLPQVGLAGWMGDSVPSQLSLSVVHFLVGPGELANLGKPLLIRGEMPSRLEGCPILGNVL